MSEKSKESDHTVSPRPWKVLKSRRDDSYRVFSIRTDRAVSPRTDKAYDFYVLESVPWVNVIAVTPDEQVVLVRQYRHGVREVTLEIPGGLVENDDSPLAAAQKELREESGFEAERWIDLGSVHPNPAIQANRCHTYLALNAFRTGDLEQDDREDIAVELAPLTGIPDLIRDGRITHALVLAAFYRFFMEYSSRSRDGEAR